MAAEDKEIHKEQGQPAGQSSLAHPPTAADTEKVWPPPKEELPKPSLTMTPPKIFGKLVCPPLTRTHSPSTIFPYGKAL